MRLGLIVAALSLAWGGAAWAQSSITLNARQGNPIIEATINDRPVRFEVDLRMADYVAVSNAASERLRLRRVPFVGIRVGVDGSDVTVAGRIARPRIEFGGEVSRAFAGIFPLPVTSRADGLIGPGALPHDVVTVVLGAEPPGARDIVFPLEDPDAWRGQANVGGHALEILINTGAQETVFNRPATRLFDADGAIPASGELAEVHLILGLRTMMQPVTTSLTVEGLALAPAMARTNAPLLGADEEETIVVTGNADPPPPSVALGRAALARCAYIRVDRRARTMTLRCA
ncbi:MAG TPA: hypothetical protein VEF55_04835 [Candidatus Binatia bacterium]|nr:hypothetical protein [Candidatus Binatia bacterium]